MIFSDRQYAVSKNEAAKLRQALEHVRADTVKHARLRRCVSPREGHPSETAASYPRFRDHRWDLTRPYPRQATW